MSKFAELCRSVAFSGIVAMCVVVAAPTKVSAQEGAGQAPIAQDDLIVTNQDRGELIITTLLANDRDPEGEPLSIVAVSQSTGGTVTLDPLKRTQVTFKPNGNFSGLYSFTYQIEDSDGLRASAVVTIQNPFLQGKGLYAGPIAGAASVPNSNGYVNLTLTGGGSFTGKLRFAGEVISFGGVFELDGTYQADFQITAKQRRRLQLTLPLDGPGPVTGIYSGGEQTIAFSLPQMTFTRKDPPPFVGDFTVGFLPPDEQKTTPAGIGYGILRISAIGSVSYSGRLGDSTPISFSGFVNPDGTAPVYASLYKSKGSFAVNFSFEEIDFIRASGQATWFKPKMRNSRFYKKGFNKVVEGTGAIYTASTEGSAPLEFPSLFSGVPNSDIFIEGAGFGKGKRLKITVPPQPAKGRYEIEPPRPNKRKVKARIDARTGHFVGTVRQPKTNATRKFRGVFLQGYNFGVGVIEGGGKTGAITLTPSEALE